MATTIKRETISLEASDMSGQKVVRVAGVSTHSNETVGEFLRALIPKMDLPETDPEGRRLTYHARLDREGRHLQTSEVVSEVLQDEDRIVLQPHIVAGCR